MFFLLFLTSCGPDYMLHYDKIVYEEIIEITEVIEEIIIIEEIIVEDTAPDYQNIWVDSFIQPASVNGVDILWVIDPSGSMHDDAPRVLNGISAMINNLPPNGWRLAIIPADYRFSEQENQFPLVPGDTPEMAENMYQLAIKGAFEAGFDAVYGYMVNNTYSSTWMRSDAALLIVFVSDEDEQSHTYFSQTLDFIQWYSMQRSHVYLSSIIHLDINTSQCNTNTMFTGQEYISATNHFNGTVIDICSEDWSQGVAEASAQIDPYEYFDLTYSPLDFNYIFVFVDGQIYPNWYYNSAENRIYFNILPSGNSLVEIAYYIN